MRACAYRLYIFPAQAPVHVLEAFHAGKTINKAAILLVVTVAEHIGDDAILARYCTPNHADVREHNLKNFNISSISESISQYAASLYHVVALQLGVPVCACRYMLLLHMCPKGFDVLHYLEGCACKRMQLHSSLRKAATPTMGKCWPSFWPTYLLTALNSARVDLDSNGDAIEPYQIMNCRIE